MNESPINSQSGVTRKPPVRFSRRMWRVFFIAVGIVLLVNAPRGIHRVIVDRKIDAASRLAASDLGDNPSIAEVQQWLVAHGFAVSRVLGWQRALDSGESVTAKKGITGGSIFWRPATIISDAYWNKSGTFREIDFRFWPFASGKFAGTTFDEVVPQWSGTLLLIAIGYILFCNSRRYHRQSRKQCVECGYPIGASPVCTECGTPVSPVSTIEQ